MVALLLYGACRAVHSSGKLAQACRQDIPFTYLAARAPTLQAVTIPGGIISGTFLLTAWWLQLSHGVSGGVSPAGVLYVLALSTVAAAVLCSLRFGGVPGTDVCILTART